MDFSIPKLSIRLGALAFLKPDYKERVAAEKMKVKQNSGRMNL